MKKLGAFIIAVIMVFGLAGAAQAIRYTVESDIEPTLMRAWRGDSITLEYSLGARFKPEKVKSARYDIWFKDDRDWWSPEYARLDIETKSYFLEVDTGKVSFDVTPFVSSLSGGSFMTTLTAKWWGDFYYTGSKVSVVSNSPEPSTMLLLGAGIFGLAAYGRRRYKAR